MFETLRKLFECLGEPEMNRIPEKTRRATLVNKNLSLMFTSGRKITVRTEEWQGRIILDTDYPSPTVLIYPDDDPKTIPYLIILNKPRAEAEAG
jgi:hypothetical protein